MNFFKKLFCPFSRKCKKNNIEPPVYLDTIEDKGDVFLVRLKGDVDMEVLASNRDKMTAVINVMNLYTKNILLDFKKVTHTDSATVAALLSRLIDIEKTKHRIGLFNIPDQLRQLIDVLKVQHNFLIYDNEPSALDAFKYTTQLSPN